MSHLKIAQTLASLGWVAGDIADVLGVSERAVADMIPGHGSRGSRAILNKPERVPSPAKQPAESILADRYYLRPGPSIRLRSNDEMPVHGVVRQFRRDGRPANEIVWKPKL